MSAPLEASLEIVKTLLGKLTHAYHYGINEFELAALKREIERAEVAPHDKEALLGVYFTVQNDPEEMKRHFDEATRIEPGDDQNYQNYVRSLINASLLREGLDLAVKCYQSFERNLDFLHLVITTAVRLGEFKMAAKYAQEFETLAKSPLDLKEDIHLYESVIDGGLEPDYQKLVSSFVEGLVSEGYQVKHTRLVPSHVDATPNLHYEAFISGSDEEAANLTAKFTDSSIIFEVDPEVLMRSTFQVLPHKLES